MPSFVLTCLDRADSLSLRMANREAHLAYVASRREEVRLAGPLLDDQEAMIGSLLILDVADMDAARAFTQQDPYAKAGLFQSVDIRAMRVTVDRR